MRPSRFLSNLISLNLFQPISRPEISAYSISRAFGLVDVNNIHVKEVESGVEVNFNSTSKKTSLFVIPLGSIEKYMSIFNQKHPCLLRLEDAEQSTNSKKVISLNLENFARVFSIKKSALKSVQISEEFDALNKTVLVETTDKFTMNITPSMIEPFENFIFESDNIRAEMENNVLSQYS